MSEKYLFKSFCFLKCLDSKERPKSKERGPRSADRDTKKPKSTERSSHSRSRSRSRSDRKKRERSATPKANRAHRIHIGRLTRNVTKDHVHEIFSNYGKNDQIK